MAQNDKTKLVKEAKNDKGSRCCWSAYQKKIRRNATQPCEQLAQGFYLRVQWLGIEPTTSRSLGPTR